MDFKFDVYDVTDGDDGVMGYTLSPQSQGAHPAVEVLIKPGQLSIVRYVGSAAQPSPQEMRAARETVLHDLAIRARAVRA